MTSLVPSGPHSYQVRLVERYFDRNGFRINDLADSYWVTLVHTQISAAPDQALNNPAGIDLLGLQWSPDPAPEVEAP